MTERPWRKSYCCSIFSDRGYWGVSATNAEGPPVPIPNTEVKLCSGENTLRETVREDSSVLTRSRSGEIHSYDWKTEKNYYLLWGCSSAGRAPALQAGGHGFESHHLHQVTNKEIRFVTHKARFEQRRKWITVRWTVRAVGDQGAQFAPRIESHHLHQATRCRNAECKMHNA